MHSNQKLNSWSNSCSKAQVSLEYLLILAAFFSVLGLVLPVAFSSADQFLESSDVLLAKRAAQKVSEKAALMQFLAEGSQFSEEYFPSKEITVYSAGSRVFFSAAGKDFFAETNSPQIILKTSFNKKFKIIFSKIGQNVQVIAQTE